MTGSAGRLAAVTGATGFIGRRLVALLARSGWDVRLLSRRDPDEPTWREFEPEVVVGALEDEAALRRLVEGADAIVHVAGLIKAPNRDACMRVNRDGAERFARIARTHAPAAHFVLVSSLAAREPELSDYAASKRAGEDAVRAVLGARASVLRPPVVYGPGDRETLVFFQLASLPWIPLLGSAEARAALIHADDLCALALAMLERGPSGRVETAADRRPDGYRWHEVMGAAARAVGRDSPRFARAPLAMLRSVAVIGDIARSVGFANMLNSQKLAEIRHDDWSVPAGELAVVPGFAPRHDLLGGFAETAAWYRERGWL